MLYVSTSSGRVYFFIMWPWLLSALFILHISVIPEWIRTKRLNIECDAQVQYLQIVHAVRRTKHQGHGRRFVVVFCTASILYCVLKPNLYLNY